MQKFFVLIFFISLHSFAQKKDADTVYFMNGSIISTPVLDTGSVTTVVTDPKDSTKHLTLDNESLFAIKYHTGNLFYLYQPDSIKNVFSRDEMWLFMQGERDAKKGFKPWGSFCGGIITGITGGASGLGVGLLGAFLGPILPVAFVGTVGLPWIRIKLNTVSGSITGDTSGIPKVRLKHNITSVPANLKQDVYILGYEREARAKRRRYALVGGGIGAALGYIAYFSLRNILLK